MTFAEYIHIYIYTIQGNFITKYQYDTFQRSSLILNTLSLVVNFADVCEHTASINLRYLLTIFHYLNIKHMSIQSFTNALALYSTISGN